MKQVTMEKKRISGFQLNIYMFHGFKGQVNIMLGGPNLLPCKSMFNSSHFMRTPDHLQTSISLIGFGNGNHDRYHLVREQEFIFIPVAIILVPFPCSTHFWFFLHELAVKMAYRCFSIH